MCCWPTRTKVQDIEESPENKHDEGCHFLSDYRIGMTAAKHLYAVALDYCDHEHLGIVVLQCTVLDCEYSRG